jgi:hypothetical protein
MPLGRHHHRASSPAACLVLKETTADSGGDVDSRRADLIDCGVDAFFDLIHAE